MPWAKVTPKIKGGVCPLVAESKIPSCLHSTTRRMQQASQKYRIQLQVSTCNTVSMSVEDELQEPLLVRLSASPEPDSTGPSSKKRKRGVVEQGAKKAAKKTKSKKTTEDNELDVLAGINNAFSHMDNQLLADYIAQRTRKYESDLSSIELEDKYIPGRLSHVGGFVKLIKLSGNAIQDTTSWDKPRTLGNLSSFLEKFSGNSTKLWSASKKNGAPHTIIVTAAGLRAADTARYVNGTCC